MSYFLVETELIGNWVEWYLIFFSQSLSNNCFFWQGDAFIWGCLILVTLLLSLAFNREEKSLRHIAMVAKFLHDNKLKRHHLHCKKWICTALNFINYISFHLVCQMLAKFSGLNLKGQYVSLEKEKQNFCVVLTYSIRWAREIRKFHVAVVQSNFANLNLLFFFLFHVTVAKLLLTIFQFPIIHSDCPPNFA